MSYQVLARKWRPRTFREMVGQAHVLRALINALDNNRLHHAYLFTGTRGVGKTTIARILARSLNCEAGVTATPCGVCGACCEINEGRFVDLIEVDAASRTKVEDTRDLLENVQYAPTRGRYKVYLIDEVHMLSTHSFNALLKTLEEPPPHVKFLLATTDPQRLPATILSRCLQFSLKRLPVELIIQQMTFILGEEGIASEPAALAQIARAADGSMRDALSLLDQAIAYGGGTVHEADVRAMLGTLDQGQVIALAEALAANDAQAVLQQVNSVAEQSPDFTDVLAELVSLLHRIALAQVVPSAVDGSLSDSDAVMRLAAQMSAEDVQLFYQIGLIGRRDLALAPDPRSGLEMVLLRMLTFRPVDAGSAVMVTPPPVAAPTPKAPLRTTAIEARAVTSHREERERRVLQVPQAVAPGILPPATLVHPCTSQDAQKRPPPAPTAITITPPPAANPAPVTATSARRDSAPLATAGVGWNNIVEALKLEGMARQLAAHCALKKHDEDGIHLTLAPAHLSLRNKKIEERLQQALSQHYGKPVRLIIDVGTPHAETPAVIQGQRETDRRQAAVQMITDDVNIKAMQEAFNARVVPESIQPV